jgi:hypothetical protein
LGLIPVLVLAGLWSRASAADWEVRSDIPYHVYGHAAATLDGRIHLLGGCHTDNWQIPSAVHQVYDPIRDKWERKADLPLAVGWGMPAVLDGKIYLFGGGYSKPPRGITSSDGAWVYDPSADKWRAIRKLPEPRMNGFATGTGSRIYISQGYNRQGGGDSEVVEEFRSTYGYDSKTDSYTRVADAPQTGCYVASGPHKGQEGRPKGMLVFDIELLAAQPSPTRAPADVSAPPKDAKRTISGLAYKSMQEGTGTQHPRRTNSVTVHYSGWTTNGKLFDSSVVRGQPATFSLDKVIAGWTEGVQLMVEGQKMRFWIPENLAYKGQQPPYGMLVFDIELIKIQ